MPGWPFWAATSDDRIDRAFDLAGLVDGERLVDLGCGDGRVLLRAAEFRGASVTGVEVDPELAASARDLLARYAVAGDVVEADFAEAPLEADVVFAYLSPATLQRLRPRLGALAPGTRIVTTGYAVPGWEPAGLADGCYLYRVPVALAPVDRDQRGWATAGLLVSLHPEARALVAAKLHHGGGPVVVTLAGDATAVAAAKAGADTAEAGDEVVVDVRFDPLPGGTLLAFALETPGHPPLRIFASVDPGQPGLWGLSAAGCEEVAAGLEAGDLSPALEEARRLAAR